MSETLWKGRPHNKIRWEFRDWREAAVYAALPFIGLFFLAIGAGGLAFVALAMSFGTVGMLVFRHPWRAFRRRNHSYRLTRDAAFIDRTNLMGMPIQEEYPITQTMKIELVERSGSFDVYFGRRVIHSKTTDTGRRRQTTVAAGFELIPDGREVYLQMLELQLEVVENGRP